MRPIISIRVLTALALASLLACRPKRETGTGGDGPAPAVAALAHSSDDIRIPKKPMLPGIKKIQRLNRVTTNRRGETVLMRLAFDKNSSDTVIWSMPTVRQGWIRIQTDDGTIRIFSERRIEVRRNGGVLNASGVPDWMIYFSTDTRRMPGNIHGPGLRLVNLANPEVIPDFDQLGFRMPLEVEGGISYIVVSIEFSKDYKGDGGYWYVMQSV